MKKYYAVSAVCSKHKITTPLGQHWLPLIWADSMCGVLPVFTNKRKAQKYAGKIDIVEFEATPKEQTTKEK